MENQVNEQLNQITEETVLLPVSETPLTNRIAKVDLSPEEQMDFQIRIVSEKQKHLHDSIQATLRGLLNMLTAPNMTGNKRERIKRCIETGVIVGLDYGVNVSKINMEEKGIFAKYEGFLGSTIARAKENGMIIIAHNFKKEEEAKQKISVGGNNEENENNGSEENRSQTDQEWKTSLEVETSNQEGVLSNG